MDRKMPISPEDILIPEIKGESSQKKEKASLAIGGYNSLLRASLFPERIVFLFQRREAEASTRLEGTYVTFQEVALEEDSPEKPDVSKQKRTNVREAWGVIHALRKAEYLLQAQDLPLSTRVIKAMHKELMVRAIQDQGVPGEFRSTSAGVGVHGEPPRYIAPEAQHISSLMSDLERYVHCEDDISSLVKIAVTHAQFEIIHPFGDGNGRTGRLLIPILMKQYGLTDNHSFFISRYFEQNRETYYTHLNNITKKGDWLGWIHFFLDSVTEHAKNETEIVENLQTKYMDGEFLKFSNAASQHIKNFIFQKPFFTIPILTNNFERENIPLKNSTGLGRMFADSKDLKILQKGKGGRPTVFSCPEILKILKAH